MFKCITLIQNDHIASTILFRSHETGYHISDILLSIYIGLIFGSYQKILISFPLQKLSFDLNLYPTPGPQRLNIVFQKHFARKTLLKILLSLQSHSFVCLCIHSLRSFRSIDIFHKFYELFSSSCLRVIPSNICLMFAPSCIP